MRGLVEHLFGFPVTYINPMIYENIAINSYLLRQVNIVCKDQELKQSQPKSSPQKQTN